MKMEYSFLTDRGEREINEDAAGARVTEACGCFAVADGLGGHAGGEVASSLAVQTFLQDFDGETQPERTGTGDFLKKSFNDAQERILKGQAEDRRSGDMKTTMTALVRFGRYIQWAHVGDTRLYCFRDNRLVRRTYDHSVPQMRVYAGELKESEIRGNEDRNRVLRVLGKEWTRPEYDLSEVIEAEPGQAFLICTDGFWEWVLEDRMMSCLRSAETPDEWLKAMRREVLKKGTGKGMDNYTAIAVFGEGHRVRKGLFGFLH